VDANSENIEKLASALFGKRVVIRNELSGDTLTLEAIPIAQRFRKLKDDVIKTRQMTLSGAPRSSDHQLRPE
jgi:hypothetical protein